MLKTNLKLAFRNLIKNRGFSLINIFGLAVGMGVAMMIGLWVYDEINFNQYHPEADRVVRVRTNFTQNDKVVTAYSAGRPVGNELRNNYGENFESVSITSSHQQGVLAVDNQKVTRVGRSVEPQFLDIIDTKITQSNPATVLADVASIVISESLAETFFKQENPLGKTIRFNNAKDYQVAGVFADFPEHSSFGSFDFFLTWADFTTQNWVAQSENNWGNMSFEVYGKLKKGLSATAVSNNIADLLNAHWSPHFQPEVFVQPLNEWYLYDTYQSGKQTGGRIDTVQLFGIIGIFVLLLACINFINLSTAQSEKRAKEVGVRKTIGSNQRMLIGQFLTESYLVVFIALVIACGLTRLALPIFNELADKTIEIPFTNPIFWLMIGGFALLTGLLAGSYPAFYLSSFRPLQVLQGVNNSDGTSWSRKALVVVQFSVSIALIIGTLVVFQQIEYAKDRSVGYNQSNILQIETFTEDLAGEVKTTTLRNRLLATGAVEEMSHSNSPLTNIWSTQGGFQWTGSDPENPASFAFLTGTPEYGKVAKWNIVAGRDFSREISTDTSAAIINQTAANLIGLDNIIGETIGNGDREFRVIGVVEDMLMESPYSPMRPAIFSLNYEWRNQILVRLKDGLPVQESIKKVESVLAELDPAAPFSYQFVDENFDRKFKSEVRIGVLARIFAFLAIFISCLGLFGLSAYVAERRTKEIGIRKVLGASILDLWTMLSKDFILLVIISCLVAVPIAWYYLSDWLNGYEYRIELNWWLFALAGISAVIITLATVSFQSIKAAVANPIHSLKDE